LGNWAIINCLITRYFKKPLVGGRRPPDIKAILHIAGGFQDMNIKVSQVGTGQWGKVLIQKFHALSGVHLAYGHKNREELAELNLTFTEDVDELIDSSDVVVVATPPKTHFELAKKILQSQKDLFLEKPIALSSQEAIELAELADEKKSILAVDHTLCHSTAHKRFQELPGTRQKAEAYFLKTSTGEKLLNAYWNMGVHMVALAAALGMEDSFHLEASDSASENRRTFTLTTSEQSLTWDFLAPENKEDMLMVGCQHFLDCVKNRQTPRTDGWHAVKTIKTLERISPEIFKQ